MKRLVLFLLTLIISMPLALRAQDAPQKSNQATLLNEVFGGYGAASVYYFRELDHNYEYDPYYSGPYFSSTGDPSSIGTFVAGYSRSILPFLKVGILFSYMSLNTDVYIQDSYSRTYGTSYDNMYGMVARVTFPYVNRTAVQVYSGVAIGMNVDLNHVDVGGTTYKDRSLKPAGELIMMGIRGGRKLGGFLELGFGTTGILTGGISYKFGTE